jgi:hypothetical protein
MVAASRGDDKAVDAARSQRVDVRDLALIVVVGVGQ